jgi:ubiquinone biosynthesis monooxygenase Coq6
MAMMTENLNLQRAFLRALESRPSLTIMDKVKVDRIVTGADASDNWPTLHLSDGRTVRARLLVSSQTQLRASKPIYLL